MTAKLTIELDEKLLAKAQAYAEASGKTLSQVVAGFFERLETVDEWPQRAQSSGGAFWLPDDPELSAAVKALYNEKGELDESKLSPLVRRLYGCAAGGDVDERDYYAYLEKKHS